MGKCMIIGCGGVASVAIHKCCQNSDVFEEIMIASRTRSKCDALKAKLDGGKTKIHTAQVDADSVAELVALIENFKPDVVLNLALPYQDLTIMEACLATKTHYVDTANYEPTDTAKFEYSWQWAYREKFREAGVCALLGSGFDPGVTSVFSAYALKHQFDEIHTIDILDANGGDHGYPFATNFNPEINIREVTAKGSYWENGRWVETEPMEIKREYDFRGIGKKDMYLLHHEEIESLARYIPGRKAHPLLHDLRAELPYASQVPRGRGHDLHQAHRISGAADRAAPVPQSRAARPREPRPPHRGQDQHRLHLYRREGRQAQNIFPLQHLRPSGMLPRGRESGHQLHHRRARDDRRDAGDAGQMEQARRMEHGAV